MEPLFEEYNTADIKPILQFKCCPTCGKILDGVRHGMYGTRPYRIWGGMKNRCRRKLNKDYHRYGGRGITYDPKWENFEGFWNDMSNGYNDKMSLDRIDNDGNYCKQNCRWADSQTQARNKRNVKLYKFKGENMTIGEIARSTKLSVNMLVGRIKVRGFSVEKSVSKEDYRITRAMKKFCVLGIKGFKSFSKYKQINARIKRNAVKDFLSKEKPQYKILDIYREGKYNIENKKSLNVPTFTVNVFEGYITNGNKVVKKSRREIYNIIAKKYE